MDYRTEWVYFIVHFVRLGEIKGSIFLYLIFLGFEAYKTPPASVAQIRPLFDDMKTIRSVSRAFYASTNYICSDEIIRYFKIDFFFSFYASFFYLFLLSSL